jgi:type I restriction enzyme R subunit
MAFNENSRVKIPALLHLMKLGYTYIPLLEHIRRGDTNIFESIFLDSLQKINPNAQLEKLNRVLDEVSLGLDYEDIGEKFLPAQNR